MAVTAQTLQLSDELRSAVSQLTDERTRQLTQAWVHAWDDISPHLLPALEQLAKGSLTSAWPGRMQVLLDQRLTASLNIALNHLQDLAKAAGVALPRDIARAVKLAGDAQRKLIGSQLPEGRRVTTGFNRVDPNLMPAIVNRSADQAVFALNGIPDTVYQNMLRVLTRDVSLGRNPRDAARQMLKSAEGQFNGGLTRALNIARTETLDAHRAAAMVTQAQHADVLAGWVWSCQLDRRSCPSCWAQHGTLHPLSEPGPIDHQQGRCSRLPRTRTWRELGIDKPELPSLLPDAQARFAALPKADQLRVMGPTRLAQLQSGELRWSQLSTRRSTAGWRDSFVTSPVGKPGPLPVERPVPVASAVPVTTLADYERLGDLQATRLATSVEERYTGWGEYLSNTDGYKDVQRTARQFTPAEIVASSNTPAGRAIRLMDQTFERPGAVVQSDLTVYRGMREVDSVFPGGLSPGQVFSDAGYTSTSMDAGHAKEFVDKFENAAQTQGHAVFRIRVPAGQRAISARSLQGLEYEDAATRRELKREYGKVRGQMSSWTDDQGKLRYHPGYAPEQEWVLPRHTSYRVVRRLDDLPGPNGPVQQWEIEVVG